MYLYSVQVLVNLCDLGIGDARGCNNCNTVANVEAQLNKNRLKLIRWTIGKSSRFHRNTMEYWNDIEQIACSTKWLCSATKNLYGMKVCQSFTTLKTGQKFQSHPFAVPIPWDDKSALHLPSSPPSLDQTYVCKSVPHSSSLMIIEYAMQSFFSLILTWLVPTGLQEYWSTKTMCGLTNRSLHHLPCLMRCSNGA